MQQTRPKILIVDDEPMLREILVDYLDGLNYDTVQASDGVEAWVILQEQNHQFDAIVLDRIMPDMDGLEVLKKIKADAKLSKIPVIMQTGSAEKDKILEGLEAGCYYYLTKPFERKLFISVLNAAISDHHQYTSLQKELETQNKTLKLLSKGSFEFRTLDEARALTTLLASVCPDPSNVAMGLSELLINAIEHGNLGISYAEKSELLENTTWESEVEYRLTQKEYCDYFVCLTYQKDLNKISFTIQDKGQGFDWQDYLQISASRSSDSHGRGIAMANIISFDSLEYRGNGNTVVVTLEINKEPMTLTSITSM
ncbi:MAG: response regulator [Woeseiaceae bacterium]